LKYSNSNYRVRGYNTRLIAKTKLCMKLVQVALVKKKTKKGKLLILTKDKRDNNNREVATSSDEDSGKE